MNGAAANLIPRRSLQTLLKALRKSKNPERRTSRMSDEVLFRIALAPSAAFIWCRYIVWPFAVISMIGLVYLRLRPHPLYLHKATVLQRSLVAAGALLLVSLAVAYLLIPKTDPQVFILWYGAAVGSTPILVPAVVVCCLRFRATAGRDKAL